MFGIGWQELFIVALVTVIVVGPQEIPRVLRTVMLGVRKVRSLAAEFQGSLDDLAREAELEELKRDFQKARNFDLGEEVERTLDPQRDVQRSAEELDSAGRYRPPALGAGKSGGEVPEPPGPVVRHE